MKYKITSPGKIVNGAIKLSSSKSISNRILMIRELCPEPFEILNLSDAQDTLTLLHILSQVKKEINGAGTYDVGPAGTTMRFLIAYFATLPGKRVLTGSERMKKRPVKVLVDALQQLGADITYLEEEGFPPLQVNGKNLKGGEIEIDGSVSSQYISALLLISPKLFNGIVLNFKGEIVSRSYINMTLKLMEEFGVYGQWRENTISVSNQAYSTQFEDKTSYVVESDWSSTSYWYEAVALAREAKVGIKGLKKQSLQGDSVLASLFCFFGVSTEFTEDGVILTKTGYLPEAFTFDFSDCPDLAQTVAVVASGLKIPTILNGLSTLKIKETDRITALQTELKKLGTESVTLGDGSLEIKSFSKSNSTQSFSFDTYDDHRMAMAFAPLALLTNEIIINDPLVVKKSYPGYWDDMRSCGFEIEEIKVKNCEY